MNNGKTLKFKNVLFCDLDGTLITTLTGKEFPQGCYDMKIRLDALEAILNYNPDFVVIVSNQGGIESGYVNEKFFKNKISWVASNIAEFCKCDVAYDYCKSMNKNDYRRKPNPGMLIGYLATITSVNDDANILMIGDRQEDLECAKNANIPYNDIQDFINKYGTLTD